MYIRPQKYTKNVWSDSQDSCSMAGFGFDPAQSVNGPTNCMTYHYDNKGLLTITAHAQNAYGETGKVDTKIEVASLPEALDVATRFDKVVAGAASLVTGKPAPADFKEMSNADVVKTLARAKAIALRSYPPHHKNAENEAVYGKLAPDKKDEIKPLTAQIGVPPLRPETKQGLSGYWFDKGADAVVFFCETDKAGAPSWSATVNPSEPDIIKIPACPTLGEAMARVHHAVPAILNGMANSDEHVAGIKKFVRTQLLEMKARDASAAIDPYQLARSLSGAIGPLDADWQKKQQIGAIKPGARITALTPGAEASGRAANLNRSLQMSA